MSVDLVQAFDVAAMRLDTVQNRALQFMDKNMVDIGIQEIIDPLKSLARSRGHAQAYIDALDISKDGWLKMSIVLNEIKGNGDIPLNILLEKGWQGGYEIKGKPLHWTGGKYGPGDHFASKVIHPGFKGYHMLDSLKNWGFIDRFLSVLIERTNTYLKETAFQ